MMDKAELAAEVDRNYDYFQRNLSTFMREHAGEYAVLKSSAIVDFFGSPGEAYREASAAFPDMIFSIQEVTDEPIDLGFFSHVGH